MKQRKEDLRACFILCYFVLVICWFLILFSMLVPEIKIVHMSFTTELNNNSTTQQVHYLPLVSARWDLLIRVPGKLVGDYICLQGNLQASFLYKNVTLVTSSVQRFYWKFIFLLVVISDVRFIDAGFSGCGYG